MRIGRLLFQFLEVLEIRTSKVLPLTFRPEPFRVKLASEAYFRVRRGTARVGHVDCRILLHRAKLLVASAEDAVYERPTSCG